MSNEAEQDNFTCLNQYRYLCEELTMLEMYRKQLITRREVEFLVDIAQQVKISPAQEEWLMRIESRRLQQQAEHGIDDNDLIEQLVVKPPTDSGFRSWNPKDESVQPSAQSHRLRSLLNRR